MPLGMEVGLSPGDFLLDGDPAPPPKKGAEPPNFRPMSIVAKRQAGWITMPLGAEVGLGPGNIVLDGDQAPPPKKKRHSAPSQKGGGGPSFRPVPIVAKWLYVSGYHFVRR